MMAAPPSLAARDAIGDGTAQIMRLPRGQR